MDRISELQEQKLHDVSHCSASQMPCEHKRNFLQHFAAENLKSAPMEGIDMNRVNARVDEQMQLWARRDAAKASHER